MAKVQSPIHLDIVDPVSEARDRAMTLLGSVGGLASGEVCGLPRVADVDRVPDLMIIATNSKERRAAVQEAVDRGARTLILEKVLFTHLDDYDEVEALFACTGVRAWVNCPRRAYPGAHRLAQLVAGTPFAYRVEGQGWGLGCNLIHHLDEFASLNGDSDLQIDVSGLERAVAHSKRPGYVEFFGRVGAASRKGGTFSATCMRGAASPRTVTLIAGNRHIKIRPDQCLEIEEGARVWSEDFPMPPQSVMTTRYVDDLISGELPRLPSYSEAAGLHRAMLASFIGHMRSVLGDETIDECPVT